MLLLPLMSDHNYREIYNSDYYKAQELLLNPAFKQRIHSLKRKFEEFNTPIPEEGFGSHEEHMAWLGNFWNAFSEIERSEEYKNGIKKITGGKKTYGIREMHEIEKFRDTFLPPLYGEAIDEILEDFGMDKKNEGFRTFVENQIFFKDKPFPKTIISTHWFPDESTGEMELFVRICGHTRKEDIANNWEFIAEDQKRLPDYIGKNKKRATFDRDNGIYELYLKIKAERSAIRSKKNASEQPIDSEIYGVLRRNFTELSLSSIRSIISKVRKFRAASNGTH